MQKGETVMRIIISPAKKMDCDLDGLAPQGLPAFLPKTQLLLQQLRTMTYQQLRALWRCNDRLASLNYERVQNMDLLHRLTPAILSFDGIQYRYMAPGVFTDRQLAYVQERLRILSGFYGMLRPFDGVTPYRLEMQARLAAGGASDLYAFWGELPAGQLFGETDTVINLASREYSRCISPYVPHGARWITCVFGQLQNGRVVETGTKCKMARGEMVRFLAENEISDPAQLRSFDRLGYQFHPERSDAQTLVFLRKPQTNTSCTSSM